MSATNDYHIIPSAQNKTDRSAGSKSKKKSQIAIKIRDVMNKIAMVIHHVTRSSHAYKHAFRLNLTLISLNICLKL